MRTFLKVGIISAAVWLLISFSIAPEAQTGKTVTLKFPDPDIGASTLGARRDAQLKTIGQFKVFHDFHFTDRLKESGITFRFHAVVDALANYKAVHYDHGSAVAVADVDGDGAGSTDRQDGYAEVS